MARYRGPRLRKCRRLDFAVFESPKFSNPRRNYVPGQHGPGQRIKPVNIHILYVKLLINSGTASGRRPDDED